MFRTLITGHKGNIGSRLAKKIDHVGLDLKDGQNVLTCELPDADVIYHLAAYASVNDSWNDPVNTEENFLTTVRLAHHYPDAKIIFASTGASFDPVTPYAFSKFASNEYLKRFHENAVVLYFSNIFGIPRSVVDIFKDREEVTIYGDGMQIRDYVHVDDIVEGLLLAKDWEPGEYQMGCGEGTTVLELAKGKEVFFAPARKEQRSSILENTTPNWKPKINVLEYVRN